MGRFNWKELNTRVQAHEAHWIWKVALRLFLTILVLVALGLTGWLVSWQYGNSDFNDYNPAVYIFIPLGLSLIWTLVLLPTLLVRAKGIHPGFAVGFDLVLWIIFGIVGGIYLTIASISYNDVPSAYDPEDESGYASSSYRGSGIAQGYPSSSSAIYNNQTYIYNSYSSDGSGVRRTPGSINYHCPYFDSCAAQRSALSELRRATNIFTVASSFLVVCAVLHFVLFVWACVDCARYNRTKGATGEYARARIIAQEMVRDMREKGEIVAVGQYPAPPPPAAQPLMGNGNGVSAQHYGYYGAEHGTAGYGVAGRGGSAFGNEMPPTSPMDVESAPQLPPVGEGVDPQYQGAGALTSDEPVGILQKGKGKEQAYTSAPQEERGESSQEGRPLRFEHTR